jgi:hypothetical protein
VRRVAGLGIARDQRLQCVGEPRPRPRLVRLAGVQQVPDAVHAQHPRVEPVVGPEIGVLSATGREAVEEPASQRPPRSALASICIAHQRRTLSVTPVGREGALPDLGRRMLDR